MNRRSIWNFLSSLRLTVVCLALGIVLVFIGTVAQADEGLYQAQARYFKQWLIVGPMFLGHQLPLLLPGGYLLGTTLLLNLVAAHIKRFVWSTKKIGIHLTHLGIVVLLVGQLATDMFSEESMLRLREGESRNYTETHRMNELVVATDSTPGNEEVISIPEPLVAKRSAISHEKIPFTLRITDYHINCEMLSRAGLMENYGKLTGALATVEGQYTTTEGLLAQAERSRESEGRASVWRDAFKAIGEPVTDDVVAAARGLSAERQAKLREELKNRFQGEMLARFKQQGGAMRIAAEYISNKQPIAEDSFPALATNGPGKNAIVLPMPEGKEMDSNNIPYAVVEVLEGTKSLGTWLLSPWLTAQDVTAAGKTWRLALRPERNYQPFAIRLLKATHEVYPGTEIPKNFQSRVRIENPSKNETREVDIYMNNPLRYSGLAFFQYQMGRDEQAANVGTSTLQIVHNPSWLTAYIGCILVGLGMLYQFSFHLFGFISKRKAA